MASCECYPDESDDEKAIPMAPHSEKAIPMTPPANATAGTAPSQQRQRKRPQTQPATGTERSAKPTPPPSRGRESGCLKFKDIPFLCFFIFGCRIIFSSRFGTSIAGDISHGSIIDWPQVLNYVTDVFVPQEKNQIVPYPQCEQSIPGKNDSTCLFPLKEKKGLRNLKWRWADNDVTAYLAPNTWFEGKWNMPADRDVLVAEIKSIIQGPKTVAKAKAVEFADVDYPERRRTFTDCTKALDWLTRDLNIQSPDCPFDHCD